MERRSKQTSKMTDRKEQMDRSMEDKMDVTRDSWVGREKELDGMREERKIAGQRGGRC